MYYVLLTSKYDITLQTNAFIASDEIASTTHFQTQYHTADKRLFLAINAFVLETNTLGAGDNAFRAGDKTL